MTTEDKLIKHFIEGDIQAFETLMSMYQNRMYSVCFNILKNKDVAQEATQDTFIKMYRSIKSFNGQSKFSSWLYKIAYRTSLDYIRKRKNTESIDDHAHEVNDEYNHEEDIENKELSSLLMKLLESLPQEESSLIRMYYLEEMSIKELEYITGLSQSNIKIKLFRTRKKLSEMVKSDFVELEAYLNK